MDLVALNSDVKAVLQGDTRCLPTGLLRPKEGQPPPANMPGNLSLLSPPDHWGDAPFEGVPGWIAWARFAEYLAGDAPVLCRRADWWNREDVAQTELRPGLKIESERNRAQEGQLYFARHIRLNDRENGRIALSLEVDGAGSLEKSLLDPPMSPFGGERRAVMLERADDSPWRTVPPPIREAIASSGHVSVVFVQIAWFRDGWIPEGWNAGEAGKPGQTATALIKRPGKADVTCTWRAARLERPETIGGWDLARGDQKPVRRFVPRGAVYYLEVQKAEDRQAILDLWDSCITDTPKEAPFEPFSYDRMGLGHVLLGTW
jgi:CRISPR-associated protein Cmr3